MQQIRSINWHAMHETPIIKSAIASLISCRCDEFGMGELLRFTITNKEISMKSIKRVLFDYSINKTIQSFNIMYTIQFKTTLTDRSPSGQFQEG